MAAPMGRIILQSDWDETFRAAQGKSWVSYKLHNLPGVHGELTCQGLSSDGRPYVTGSDGFTVSDVSEKHISVTYTEQNRSRCTRFFSPNDTYRDIHKERKTVHCVDTSSGGLGVSSDSEGRLRLWQTSNGEVRRELEGHLSDIYCCRFFPSGLVLLTGGADMQLKIWCAEKGKCAATLLGHKAGILDIAIIEKGRNVISCGRDGTAKIWDVSEQKCITTFEDCGGTVNGCSLGTPDNTCDLGTPDSPVSEKEVMTEGKLLLLACENKTLQAYGLHSKKKIFQLDCHDAVNCCDIVTDNLVVCGMQDGHISIIDIRNHSVPVKEWKEHRGIVHSVKSYKQGFFASTGDGSCFYVNEVQDVDFELTGPDCDPVYKLSLDGTHLFNACRDGSIRKYKL